MKLAAAGACGSHVRDDQFLSVVSTLPSFKSLLFREMINNSYLSHDFSVPIQNLTENLWISSYKPYHHGSVFG